MTIETTSRTYEGIARILDRNGMLIDVGKAELMTTDPVGWKGTLSVFKGSSLENKHITAIVRLATDQEGLATVGPKLADLGNDLISVAMTGVDDVVPF
ncbi:MAG: hypothetical protein OEX04_04005 [Acidimicrobiia bacterium]|nr:hypothetical protein [Acidimicrobiia bacterium]MDH4306621.1 hypothetical protein [Acidimicrobiia bacterium]MDH5292069.1 hypothetical protein [Acidimicrobiia bacterium]